MEEIDLAGPEFWEGESSLVLSNPALEAPPESLLEAVERGEELKGHVVFRTSGSGGEAKFVALSKAALLSSAEAVNRRLEADGADRWLRALPCYHVGGFGIHARAYAAGARAVVVMGGKWDAARFTETCAREKITLTSLVPRQVVDLAEAGLGAPGSLRAVIVGGDAMPEAPGRRAREEGWPLLQSYGMTEAGSQVATQGLGALGEDFTNAMLPLLDHWEARVDGEGILELKGEALLSAYVERDPGERGGIRLADPKVDGWFRTGDRVVLGEGPGRHLRFLERDGERVKVLGELVSLRDLRKRLEDAAGPEMGGEVALAEIADDRLGVRLVLVHTAAVSAVEAEGVGALVNAGLPGYARLVERRAVAGIPRTGLGKVDYEALRRAIRGVGGVDFPANAIKRPQK